MARQGEPLRKNVESKPFSTVLTFPSEQQSLSTGAQAVMLEKGGTLNGTSRARRRQFSFFFISLTSVVGVVVDRCPFFMCPHSVRRLVVLED